MAEPFGAAREAPKGLAPGGDELAEADGSHCEAVALEHERAQPDGRARVGDELARLEVLLGRRRCRAAQAAVQAAPMSGTHMSPAGVSDAPPRGDDVVLRGCWHAHEPRLQRAIW